jgi:hypothetical protein
MIISHSHLRSQGRIAAEAWDECDTALTELQDGYGAPYEAARTNLTKDLILADGEGFDLDLYTGKDSEFRFDDINVNILVRISKKPSEHTKLDQIEDRILKAETDLKVLKARRKALIEELLLRQEIHESTDKIVAAFTRLKK